MVNARRTYCGYPIKVDLINELKDKVKLPIHILWQMTIPELIKLKKKVLEKVIDKNE